MNESQRLTFEEWLQLWLTHPIYAFRIWNAHRKLRKLL